MSKSLSVNNFTDEDAKYLASGIEANEYIVGLNMSHNCISEDGSMYLGKGIAANDTIEDLDLSWNSIRKKGAVLICQAVKVKGLGPCLPIVFTTKIKSVAKVVMIGCM